MDDDSIDYGMDSNDYAYDESEELEQTQETQSTQQASQPTDPAVDSHLWGYLVPCSAALTRIDFWRIHPRYTIGRNTETNQVVLPGFKVSGNHCIISWDGEDKENSTVVVQDLSSNGTFINSQKIGHRATRILRDGNEIAFGTSTPQSHNNGLEDYRFVYRHIAGGLPSTGLYAAYDVGVELGKGSFASVKRAIHKHTGKWYAVKMISAAKTVRQNGASRHATFAREISIMEKLEHRNVCKLVEVFFHDDNSINLVLELVQGGDLLEHILKSETGLTELDARDITYQMCDALSYIHSKGITHRDLKPENVLLTLDNPPLIKVADFGLAKVVDSLTMLRTMCGTPSYLAPEVVQEPVDGYSNLVDSWSAGVIVYAMLTNTAPFGDEDPNVDVRTRILTRRVDWLSFDEREFSLEARDFVRQLLQVDTKKRMSLTEAMYHDWLRQHLPFHGPSQYEDDDDFGQRDTPMQQEPPAPQQQQFTGGARSTRSGQLQRRQPAGEEEGENLPELTAEMVAYANAHSGATPPGKGSNKRVHAELTPLQEDEVNADDNDNAARPVGKGLRSQKNNVHNNNEQPRRSSRRTKVARKD